MKIYIILTAIFIFMNFSHATEVTVIELHNKSIDQLLNEDLNSKNIEIDDLNQNNNEPLETENTSNLISEYSNSLQEIEKQDLNFLLNNINQLNSNILKSELINILSLDNNNTPPNNFNEEDFNRLIIDSLLSLGDRNKSYKIIQTFSEIKNLDYNNFYKKFELDFLLSTYQLSEACDYRNQIKNLNLENENNFFLKVDIFCLILEEKFDEANLLNSLLYESSTNKDKYFQHLFNILQNPQNLNDSNFENSKIIDSTNKDNIFLYSAMNRISNLSVSSSFLEIDPNNLALPILLSSSSDIELRLKAAHFAYLNNLINIDSLAALYQTVDFTYDELNNPEEILSNTDNNIEIVMSYFNQLINIQLLPTSRLDAIIQFWNFAEKNSLELIAFELSIKSLATIEPTQNLSEFGSKIAKAYTYHGDFVNAEKWIIFSENSLKDASLIYELNTSKLLFNLFKAKKSDDFIDILFDNLKSMNRGLLDEQNPNHQYKNETLHIIFSTLNEGLDNPFNIDKEINENRLMPSLFIINEINSCIENKNYPKLLLSIIASLNSNKWNQIHPEHLRLILLGMKEYKQGAMLNDIILEVLKYSKII